MQRRCIDFYTVAVQTHWFLYRRIVVLISKYFWLLMVESAVWEPGDKKPLPKWRCYRMYSVSFLESKSSDLNRTRNGSFSQNPGKDETNSWKLAPGNIESWGGKNWVKLRTWRPEFVSASHSAGHYEMCWTLRYFVPTNVNLLVFLVTVLRDWKHSCWETENIHVD